MDLISEEQKVALLFQKDNKLIEMICTIEKIFDDFKTISKKCKIII